MWNTLKLFIRSLKRNNVISTITIGGYAISMAVIIILSLFIIGEKSVNKSFPNAKDIYRVKRGENVASVPETLLTDVKEKVPGVEKMCVYSIGEALYEFEDNKAMARFMATNDNFLDIFSFEFVHQSANPTLLVKDNIILTKQFSEQLFGAINPVGEMLEVNNEMLNIVGVVTDPPQNSSFVFDALTSVEMTFSKSELVHNEERHNMLKAFVLLNDKVDIETVNDNISGMLDHWQAFKNQKLSLQPFSKVYFDNRTDDDLIHANADMIYLLSCIAVIILFMTIFNYVNLTISSGYERLNEIGIKKATGAGRMNIFKQFIIESLFLCLFALILAIFIATLIAPLFSEILGKRVEIMELILQPQTLLTIMVIFLIIGMVSGFYPALIVSGISPIQIINHQKILKSGNNRTGIITIQFIFTIILVTSLLFINQQLKYVKNKNLGFDKELLIKLHLNGNSQKKWKVLKNKLIANPSIVSASASLGTPMEILGVSEGNFKDSGDKTVVDMQVIGIDEDFVKAFDLTLLEGRNISSSDSNVCLINEHLHNFLEWNDIVGKKVFGSAVIGVVKDFHHLNLHSEIGHLQLSNLSSLGPGIPSSLNIRISGNISQNLEFIRKTFNEVEPGTPVQYQFYDDWIQNFYQKEESQANAIKLFTAIAIIISCLGLIGLVENTTNKKVKEIGIRKVNGAKVWEVITMLNKDFVKWVMLAFAIATPVAWYFMNKWLENFAYKTELSWWIFVLAGVLALGIALLTVSWQSWKAATRNPVEALRYE